MRLSGRKALVVGLGKSGIAAARLLATRGASVAVCDDQPADALRDSLRQLAGVAHEEFLGGLREDAFRGRDLMVVSPGVPLSTPQLVEAGKRGAEVMNAFQEGYPDLIVFTTWAQSLPYQQAGGNDPAKLAAVV